MNEKSIIDSNDNSKYYYYGNILAKYDTEEDLYSNFMKSLYNEIDKYNSKN